MLTDSEDVETYLIGKLDLLSKSRIRSAGVRFTPCGEAERLEAEKAAAKLSTPSCIQAASSVLVCIASTLANAERTL